ncbi:MAG: DUF5591 domain-containing protein [Methanobacteriaceae archaeon]|nr:DUF5591 domain-containing protein [Methanobacteriaceae archaeon]
MKIPCITEQSLYRVEVQRWQKRMKLLEPYTDTIVVLPCSMKKPYSQSKSHSLFMKYSKGLQEVILTSPFGICPRELEKTYPIQSYDASTTGDWSYEEMDIAGKCLKEYVKDKKVIAHVSGGYKKACEMHLDNVVFTCEDDNCRSKESLENLKQEVKKADKISKKAHRIHDLRSIARYQFNTKKADVLIPDDTKTYGKFNIRIMSEKTQIATLHFETGLYTLNLPGGELLNQEKINRVFIDFDLQSNTLFAPGINDADSSIIPQDEVVIIKDNQVVGVGKAMMAGDEMKNSNMGIGVKVRHRIK